MSTCALSLLLAGCTAADYAPLFAADERRLSRADQRAILGQMTARFTHTDDGRLLDANCGDVAAETELVDLNGDGVFEVFVALGNACLSGHTGRSLSLFVRDTFGVYHDQFGFPAYGYVARDRGVDGYPDLELGGPGFCFPVWRWNGSAYIHHCNLPQTEGGCEGRGQVCLADAEEPTSSPKQAP